MNRRLPSRTVACLTVLIQLRISYSDFNADNCIRRAIKNIKRMEETSGIAQERKKEGMENKEKLAKDDSEAAFLNFSSFSIAYFFIEQSFSLFPCA